MVASKAQGYINQNTNLYIKNQNLFYVTVKFLVYLSVYNFE